MDFFGNKFALNIKYYVLCSPVFDSISLFDKTTI